MYRQRWSGGNKYKAVSQTYNGYTYHSKFEAQHAAELDLRVKAGDIQSWERQYKIELRVNGQRITNYYCDFRVLHNDGSYELVETQGVETRDYVIKRRLLEAVWLPEHPDHTYTVIKQKNYRRY